MFSLIITIISIALVAALALATIYYGGSAFSAGSAKAQLATAVSQAQQIAGAMTLAISDGNAIAPTATVPFVLAGLTPNYLTQIPTAPAGAAWTISPPPTSGGVFSLSTTLPAAACSALAANANLASSQYFCSGSSGTTFTYND
jgi:hypothetical protein